MSPQTIIAPRGWWDLADADRFYPPDLPEDWRLTYFANAFGAVFLPYETWSSAAEQERASWPDAVHADFRFVAERAPIEAQALASEQTLEHLLEAHLGGWVGPYEDRLPPRDGADALCLPWRSTAGSAAPDGYAALAPSALYRDPRRAKQWLQGLSEARAAPPRLVVLTRPHADTLESWQTLIQLLGLA